MFVMIELTDQDGFAITFIANNIESIRPVRIKNKKNKPIFTHINCTSGKSYCVKETHQEIINKLKRV